VAENTATPAVDSDDPFAKPTRSAFPKLEDLNGRLLLVKPLKVERDVAGKFGKQDRITADIVVLDDPDEGVREISKMYLSQKGMVGMLEDCLRPGKKSFVLGRLTMTATSDWADKAEAHADGIEGLLADWFRKGGKGEKPQFYWDLAEYTDADANKARTYIRENDSFAAAAS
jgi:hypothetical protein